MGKMGRGGASARRAPDNGGGARSGLSLERFAGAKTSTYDRKAVLQAQREENIRRHAKYKKLKARLVEQGVLGAEQQPDFQDNVSKLESELMSPEFLTSQAAMQQRQQQRQQMKKRKQLEGQAPDGTSDEHSNDHAASVGAKDAQAAPPSFLASQHFQGSRPGYKFQKGLRGVGYYVDKQQQRQQARQRKKAAGEKPPAAKVARLNAEPQQHDSQQAPATEVAQPDDGTSARRRGAASASTSDPQAGHAQEEGQGSRPGKRPKQRKVPQLERLAAKVQREKAAAAEAHQAAAAERAAREARIRDSQKHRSQDRHKMFMRTPKGQPLMKFRIDKILGTLERERQGKQ